MRWSSHADILAYMVVVGLVLTGVFAMIAPENFSEQPPYYFICAFFVLMFIFSVKRGRRLFGRNKSDEND